MANGAVKLLSVSKNSHTHPDPNSAYIGGKVAPRLRGGTRVLRGSIALACEPEYIEEDETRFEQSKLPDYRLRDLPEGPRGA